IPIGLICCAVGGTPIEAWMSEKTLRRFNQYDDELNQNKNDDNVNSVIQADEERIKLWYQHLDEHDQGLRENWYEITDQPHHWSDFEVPNSWKNIELEDIRGSVWFTKE